MLLKGTIIKISDCSSGFIISGSKEVFFHHSALEWGSFGQLEEGQAVEYELYDGPSPLHFGYPGGPQAISVRPR